MGRAQGISAGGWRQRRHRSAAVVVAALSVALAAACSSATNSSTDSASLAQGSGAVAGGNVAAGVGAGQWDCPGGVCSWTSDPAPDAVFDRLSAGGSPAIEGARPSTATSGSAPATSTSSPPVTTAASGGKSSASTTVVPGPGASAGITDDNVGWDAYLRYRAEFLRTGQAVLDLPVDGRQTFTVVDAAGRTVFGASIVVENAAGVEVGRMQTHADGRALFVYPGPLAPSLPPDHYAATVTKGAASATVALAADTGSYRVALPFTDTPASTPVAVDVQFVIDATGSMGPDIARLRSAIAGIASQIEGASAPPDLRLGVTLYRDRGDLFTTRTFGLTPDVSAFTAALDAVQADGGGDTPEDVQAGLADALAKPGWRTGDAVKLVFLIGDAPPHLYPDEVSYADSIHTAVGSGIKIIPLATSALDDVGQFVFRQLAQQTSGRFVRLAGGSGGSGGSNAASDAGAGELTQVVARVVADEVAARTS